jgi:hypothetical protein
MRQHFQDTNFPGLHSTLAPIRFSHLLMGRAKPKRFEPRFPRLHQLPAHPILQLTSRCQDSHEAATHTLPDEERTSTPKAKAADKAKEKIKARDAHSPTTNTLSNQLSAHAYTSAKRKPSKSPNCPMTATTPWTPTLARKLRTNHDNRPQVARSFVCTAQTPLMSPKPATPTPIQRSNTIARTTAST